MGVMPAAMAGPGPRRRGDAIVGDELDTRCVKRGIGAWIERVPYFLPFLEAIGMFTQQGNRELLCVATS